MMKKLLSLLLILSLPALAQVTGTVYQVRAQYLSETERIATVLPAGLMAYDEADPSKLYLGDGLTLGGVRVSPPTVEWDHSATKDIRLNSHRLQLGNGYTLLSVGGWGAFSGGGYIVGQGNSSEWGQAVGPIIRISGGEALAQITTFSWDAGEAEFVLTAVDIDEGEPDIQHATDLVDGNWTNIAATVTGPSGGQYTARFAAPGTVGFFRAIYETGGEDLIELLKNTELTGDLSVSGNLTGGQIRRSIAWGPVIGPLGTGGNAGYVNGDLDTGTYTLGGLGLDTASTTQRSGTYRTSAIVPATGVWPASNGVTVTWWAESNNSANNKIDVELFGSALNGTGRTLIASAYNQTVATANIPVAIQLSPSAWHPLLTLEVTPYTRSDFAAFVGPIGGEHE